VSTYVIGDLQGCFVTLEKLLATIAFQPAKDRLWFVGDLVNRGEGSLECLRFVHGLGDRATVVLGNHDLHLLARAEGFAKPHRLDTLDDILSAPDREALLSWLRHRPLLHVDGACAMVHAGLMPQWSWAQAQAYAREVESALQSTDYRLLLETMYGNEPTQWRDDLTGSARRRFLINTFTRMRTLGAAGEHTLKFKGELAAMPPDQRAWFDVPSARRATRKIFAGHWSALGYYQTPSFVGLDTGCIWGGSLSAFRLEDARLFQTPSAERSAVGTWE
jgi:bis(5'-nucleosyl)-tetraphosphatase (symmetrical)